MKQQRMNNHMELQLVHIEHLEKGKRKLSFNNNIECIVYESEIRSMCLYEQMPISQALFDNIVYDIVLKRAKKRAMYLLERMARTEQQIRKKLLDNQYPDICIDEVIAYLKQYHYIDDENYARRYIQCNMHKYSKYQILNKLQIKGIASGLVKEIMEIEYEGDEIRCIKNILNKRKYSYQDSDEKDFSRHYRYLIRTGFRSSDILKVMKQKED